jgi:hypothetical protein
VVGGLMGRCVCEPASARASVARDRVGLVDGFVLTGLCPGIRGSGGREWWAGLVEWVVVLAGSASAAVALRRCG